MYGSSFHVWTNAEAERLAWRVVQVCAQDPIPGMLLRPPDLPGFPPPGFRDGWRNDDDLTMWDAVGGDLWRLRLEDHGTAAALRYRLLARVSADVTLVSGLRPPEPRRWHRVSVGGTLLPGPYPYEGAAYAAALVWTVDPPPRLVPAEPVGTRESVIVYPVPRFDFRAVRTGLGLTMGEVGRLLGCGVVAASALESSGALTPADGWDALLGYLRRSAAGPW